MSENEKEYAPGVFIDRRRTPGTIPPQVIESMVANSQNLITEAQLLRQQLGRIDTNETQVITDRKRFTIILALIVVMVAGQLVLGLMNRNGIESTEKLLDAVADCLDDGRIPPDGVTGECFKAEQARERGLLEEIQERELHDDVSRMICYEKTQDPVKLEQCVIDNRKNFKLRE